MYIDVHCHLDTLKDIEGVVARAKDAGVNIIVSQGTDVESNRKVLGLSEKYPEVKVALGIYPLHGLEMSEEEIDKEFEFIEKNAEKIVAIGEVGMDFKGDHSEEDIKRQEKLFRRFVRLSIDLDKPIIIHSRKAEERCIEILEEERASKVIMHCFCGKKKFVDRISENNWSITVPTTVTRLEQFQSIAKDFDLDQLFCETDSPYLHPDKGAEHMSNEPSNVVRSYEKIAELRGIDVKEVERKISDNWKRIIS
jgi:TatD DNase family protein